MGLRVSTGHVSGWLKTPLPRNDMFELARSLEGRLPGGWAVVDVADAPDVSAEMVFSFGVRVSSVALICADPLNCVISLRESSTPERIGYITYAVLERERQLRGMVTVHGSAALLPSGGAVLLLGDKGSGKTSTLLQLAALGARPIGDDLLVLRLAGAKVEILPGKRISAVRYMDMAPIGTLQYESKREVDLLDHGFIETAADIRKIVRLNIHSATTENLTRRAAPASLAERLRLHENFVRYINGSATPLEISSGCTFGVTFPMDCDRCARTRSTLIAALLGRQYYYVQARNAATAARMVLNA